jgi:uncharacterized membrane protein
MLYNSLKIFHILFAAGLIISLVHAVYLWQSAKNTTDRSDIQAALSIQTGLVILPLAILQLVLGFTMISIKQYDLNALWIRGSILAFMIMILSWLSFTYLFVTRADHKINHYGQIIFLSLALAALLFMIFCMANKI